MAQVEILLNGETRKLKPGTTVDRLVRNLGLDPNQLAVEYNLQILKKKRWAATALTDGDRVEIVHFVGGGASVVATSHLSWLHSNGSNKREVLVHEIF